MEEIFGQGPSQDGCVEICPISELRDIAVKLTALIRLYHWEYFHLADVAILYHGGTTVLVSADF